MKLILQITAGILIAVALLAGAVHYSGQQQLHEVEQQLAQINAANQAKQQAARQAEMDRLNAVAQQRAREAQARADKATRETEKERAWQAYFRPSPRCASPGDEWAEQVECSNEYMRARAAWEKTYVP